MDPQDLQPLGVLPLPSASGFSPTRLQRQAKAKLLTALEENQSGQHVNLLDPTTLARLAGNRQVLDWLQEPNFKGWFLDNTELNSRVRYLLDRALEAVEQVLDSPDPKSDGAKIAATKLLMDFYKANKPTQKEELDHKSAERFIKENKALILPLLGLPANYSVATLEESQPSHLLEQP